MSKTAKTPRKPGRPAESLATRDTILDVAEQQFAALGFAGTTLRDIARQAEVNQALIGYYFGSKQALFEAVYKRRGSEVSTLRMRALDAVEAAANGTPPDARNIILAYLRPQFDIKRQYTAWSRLQARIHTEPEYNAFQIRKDVYDIVTQRYIAALENALPHIDPADIHWRMTFMIGAYLYVLADVARLDEVSTQRYRGDDIDETIDRLASYFVGGMLAPSTYAFTQHQNQNEQMEHTGQTRAENKPKIKI
ncbi:MAG: TetR family transcriptional regulator [Acetobacter sp.]